MTEYIVLREIQATNGPAWEEVGAREARSAKAAIREEVDGSDIFPSNFVAVPARSWRPTAVAVETRTQLKFT